MPWTATARGPVEAPLWRAMMAATRPASIHELHQETSAHPNAIQHRLSRWVLAGLVDKLPGEPGRYAMSDTTARTPIPPRVSIDGRATPRPRSIRERMWAAIRVLRQFDLPMLMISAGATRRSAEDYVNCLQRSGHLRIIRRGNPVTGDWSIFTLVHNTGRLSPQVAHRPVDGGRLREVVDRNTGIRTDISPAAVSLRRRSSAAPVDGGRS